MSEKSKIEKGDEDQKEAGLLEDKALEAASGGGSAYGPWYSATHPTDMHCKAANPSST